MPFGWKVRGAPSTSWVVHLYLACLDRPEHHPGCEFGMVGHDSIVACGDLREDKLPILVGPLEGL
jgi:hypothetical protein